MAILIGDEKKIIKKWELLWMLKNEKVRVSPDIKLRYHTQSSKKRVLIRQTEEENGLWKDNVIRKGQHVAVLAEQNFILCGRVVAFQSFVKSSKKFFPLHASEVDMNSAENVSVLLDAAFSIKLSDFSQTSVDLFGDFKSTENYLFHFKAETNFDSFFVQHSVIDIISSHN